MSCTLQTHNRAYHLSLSDAAVSILTLGTAVSYAKRHWDLAQEAGCQRVWGHRIIAALEILPLVGMCTGLIERIAVLIYNKFFNSRQNGATPLTSEPKKPEIGNERRFTTSAPTGSSTTSRKEQVSKSEAVKPLPSSARDLYIRLKQIKPDDFGVVPVRYSSLLGYDLGRMNEDLKFLISNKLIQWYCEGRGGVRFVKIGNINAGPVEADWLAWKRSIGEEDNDTIQDPHPRYQ